MKHHRFPIRASVVALLSTLPALADDFDTEKAGLRLNSAITRLSTFPDVIAKAGANAASLKSSSPNPAALDWLHRSPPDELKEVFENAAWGFSAQGLSLHFQNDTEWLIGSQSLLYFSEWAGVFRFSFIELRSDEEPIRGEDAGLISEFDLNVFRLEWGRRSGTRCAPGADSIGLSVAYQRGELNATSPDRSIVQPVVDQGRRLGTARLNFDKSVVQDVNREAFNIRFGWQRSIAPRSATNDHLLLGTIVEYTHQLGKQETHRITPDVEPIDGLVPRKQVRDGALATQGETNVARHTSHGVLVRTGLAWKYWDPAATPDCPPKLGPGWINLDYQWGWFRDEAAELQSHRLHAAVDVAVLRAFTLSAGFVVDDRQNVSWAAGLDFVLPDRSGKRSRFGKTGIDLFTASIAYQHDPVPELGAEFGHSQVWSFGMGFAF